MLILAPSRPCKCVSAAQTTQVKAAHYLSYQVRPACCDAADTDRTRGIAWDGTATGVYAVNILNMYNHLPSNQVRVYVYIYIPSSKLVPPEVNAWYMYLLPIYGSYTHTKRKTPAYLHISTYIPHLGTDAHIHT